MKKNFLLFVKLSVTIALFYFILKDHDLEHIFQKIASIHSGYFLLAVLLYLSVFLLFAYRWQLINRLYQIDISFSVLFSDYLIAFALNNVLPSSIGGDVWRMKRIKEVTDSRSKSLMIPLVERISGFVAVILVAPVSFVYFSAEDINEPFVALLLIIILILYFLFSNRFVLLLDKLLAQKISEKYFKYWTSLKEVVFVIHQNKKTFIIGTILSALVQFIYTLSSVIVLKSLGIEFEFLKMLAIVPIVYVVAIIPISINGFGIREKVMSDAFVIFSMRPEMAITASFLISIKQVIIGLIGAVIFLFNKKGKE